MGQSLLNRDRYNFSGRRPEHPLVRDVEQDAAFSQSVDDDDVSDPGTAEEPVLTSSTRELTHDGTNPRSKPHTRSRAIPRPRIDNLDDTLSALWTLETDRPCRAAILKLDVYSTQQRTPIRGCLRPT